MNLTSLHHYFTHVPHQTSLYVLLCVIPRSSCVGRRDGHLHSADDGSRKEAYQCFGAKEESKKERSNGDLNNIMVTRRPGLTRSFNAAFVLTLTQDL